MLIALMGLCLLASCRFECTVGTIERQPQARGEPEFGEIVMSHGVEGINAAPIDDVTSFDADNDVIFAVLHVENLKAPIEFTARWYYGEEEVFNVSAEIKQDLVDTHVYSNLESNGMFPRGPHSVEITINGEIVGRKNFTIE
jgi:hypothetical protein